MSPSHCNDWVALDQYCANLQQQRGKVEFIAHHKQFRNQAIEYTVYPAQPSQRSTLGPSSDSDARRSSKSTPYPSSAPKSYRPPRSAPQLSSASTSNRSSNLTTSSFSSPNLVRSPGSSTRLFPAQSPKSTPPTPQSLSRSFHLSVRTACRRLPAISASKMLNAKKLSEMLTLNVDENLWPRMFVMSPNGTLLAYSTPANIKELRDQAALISMAWKERESSVQDRNNRPDSPASIASSVVSVGSLETLTIEYNAVNLIVRAIQPKLLLVMVGGAPPKRKKDFKLTAELNGGSRYPSEEPLEAPTSSKGSPPGSPRRDSAGNLSTSHSSMMSQRDKDIKAGLLHIQRKKLDGMTRYIRDDFDLTGFVMPDDSSFP